MPRTSPVGLSASLAEENYFCLRCLHKVTRRAAECAGCGTPFTGSGSFDRLAGTPPPASGGPDWWSQPSDQQMV